jgi:hypothetical protein
MIIVSETPDPTTNIVKTCTIIVLIRCSLNSFCHSIWANCACALNPSRTELKTERTANQVLYESRPRQKQFNSVKFNSVLLVFAELLARLDFLFVAGEHALSNKCCRKKSDQAWDPDPNESLMKRIVFELTV